MNILLGLLANRYVLGSILIAGLVGGIYLKYSLMANEIEDLRNENKANSVVIQEQRKTITQIEKDYKTIISSKEEVVKEVKKLQETNKELQEKLYRENQGKKSLGEIARKKAKTVERLVNAATEDVIRCFELISEGKECE